MRDDIPKHGGTINMDGGPFMRSQDAKVITRNQNLWLIAGLLAVRCTPEISAPSSSDLSSRLGAENAPADESSPSTAMADPASVPAAAPSLVAVHGSETFIASGSWVVPPGVYSAKIELWGGQGINGKNEGSGGGGGGAYAVKTISTSPGNSLDFLLAESQAGAGGDAKLGDMVASGGKPGRTCTARRVAVFSDGSGTFYETIMTPGRGGKAGTASGGEKNMDGTDGTPGAPECTASGMPGQGADPSGERSKSPPSAKAQIKITW